jgi:hypothetical protein
MTEQHQGGEQRQYDRIAKTHTADALTIHALRPGQCLERLLTRNRIVAQLLDV